MTPIPIILFPVHSQILSPAFPFASQAMPHSGDTDQVHQNASDFSDIIHGEDMEFRLSNKKSFPVNHKIGLFGQVQPPSFISQMSENQLVTLAGAASGFLAGVVVCPLDVVKTRLQAQESGSRYRGFLGTFRTIFREEGIRGLYRGVVPVTVGYLPTWAIYFTVYERAKVFYPGFFSRTFDVNVNSLNHFAASITAGVSSSCLINPIWVVKTRLMIQTGKEDVVYKGTIDAFRKMYRAEGLGVFYSGLVPSLLGLVHVGIHFPVYEAMKSFLGVDSGTNKLARLLVASSVSKMIASTITYPHEILRTRLQMRSSSNAPRRTILEECSRIYRKDSFKGFYAGYFTNLARTVPASAVTLVSFEYFKTYLLDISGKS